MMDEMIKGAKADEKIIEWMVNGAGSPVSYTD